MAFLLQAHWDPGEPSDWVAVKELNLSYYIGGTISILYIPIMVTLFKFLNSNPAEDSLEEAVISFGMPVGFAPLG